MTAKAILLGRIGKKDSKTVKDNKLLVILSVATNVTRKDATGQKQEITSWHYVNCFGKLAEIVQNYANVGDLIYLEADISHKKITAKDLSRWTYSLQATQVELIGKTAKHSDSADIGNTAEKSPVDNYDDIELPF